MNERIKELVLQANPASKKIYESDNWEYNCAAWCAQDVEKFVELIVRECAEIATEQGNTAEHSFTATRAKWFRLGAIKSATMIKRTFGVEE